MLWCKTIWRVSSDGLWGDQDDRLLQRCSAGGPHGAVNALSGVATGAEAFRRGARGKGIEAFAYMDGVSLCLVGVTINAVRIFAFLRRELDAIGIVVNPAKTVAIPPTGHAPSAEEISLLGSVDVRIADKGGVTVVGVPIGTDGWVLERAMEAVKDGGADRLARCLANMPDKQAVALISIESLGQRTTYPDRARDTSLSLEACRREDNGAQWAYEKILGLPGAAGAQSFFQEGCPDNRLALQPHPQAQARLSTGAGRLGLPSTEARQMSVFIGSGVGILPKVWQTPLARWETE